jgi:hypothetical protein
VGVGVARRGDGASFVSGIKKPAYGRFFNFLSI